jgi:hypothetical protein
MPFQILLYFLLFFGNLCIAEEKLYFVSAINWKYYNHLINLIGSIHKIHFEELGQIAVFDLGMTSQQRNLINKIEKVVVYDLEKTHPDILKDFYTGGRTVPGWYAWKPVCIKQALDMFPYVLWMDAGMIVKRPINALFKHIIQNGYFLYTIGDLKLADGSWMHPIRWSATKFIINTFKLDTPENKWILDMEQVDASFIGASRAVLESFIKPLYEFTRDFRYFADDGSSAYGLGTGRHDQLLTSVFAYLNNMTILKKDYTQKSSIPLSTGDTSAEFYSTWDKNYVCHKTHIYHSRGDQINLYPSFVRYKK